MNRREFLLAASAAASIRTARLHGAVHRHLLESETAPALDGLTPFVDPLPIPPVAVPVGRRRDKGRDISSYRIVMQEVTARVHRDLPPTRFWSFGRTFPGPTIEARRGEGVEIDWVNRLPATHFLPVDHTIHGAEPGLPDGRAVVHVHGAKVTPECDGQPDDWHAPGESVRFFYPNDQEAATLWYHDHTMGINRLNVYAGLMGVYILRDEAELALGLPTGDADVPLLICDRSLTADGQLDYPTSGDPDAPWVPEAEGDAILINGVLLPYVSVTSRRYRFRVVNGSNGRFLRLTLSTGSFIQIGTDQGLMEAPVSMNRLHLAPAERADIVVDFGPHGGERIALLNDGSPILQFRVSNVRVRDASVVPDSLRAIRWMREEGAERTRVHALGEGHDALARPTRMLLNGLRWHDPVTEHVALGATEIWSFANTTEDSHPIHLHLVRFQILDRRKFDVWTYETDGRMVFTGPPIGPEPGERGWKDTVRADGGMVTRIVMRFDGYLGRYMWHCHILEHSDNEMMRPFEVVRRT